MWKISIVEGASDANPSRIFYPDTLPVKIGDTVVWENNDSIVHHIASGVPEFQDQAGYFFDTNEIKPGESSGIILENNTYDAFYYLCKIHPWMTGKIFYSNKPGAQPDTENPIVLNKLTYQKGEIVRFSGEVTQNFYGIDYQLLIFNEDNQIIDSIDGYFDDDSKYTNDFEITNNLPNGKYFVKLVYGIPSTVAQTSFEVSDINNSDSDNTFDSILKNLREFWIKAITFLYA